MSLSLATLTEKNTIDFYTKEDIKSEAKRIVSCYQSLNGSDKKIASINFSKHLLDGVISGGVGAAIGGGLIGGTIGFFMSYVPGILPGAKIGAKVGAVCGAIGGGLETAH